MTKKEQILFNLELESKGLMKIDLDDFQKNTYPDNRIVGFIESDGKLNVYIIGMEKMNKMNEINSGSELNYKNYIDSFPDVKFYNQRIKKDEYEIDTIDSLDLIKKYYDSKSYKNDVEKKGKSKAKRLVKPVF